ncbi:hypothetical protein HJG60_011144 [Phyllostomus discolor]|uniref:Uncharacterized protein n=1 Tax=Phyllostomus discolor TaxID=89673 RepID=A0A834E1D3_9CHIR|nr:hypothetical protein HJG60_011144 [Phyllostomus discolor]
MGRGRAWAQEGRLILGSGSLGCRGRRGRWGQMEKGGLGGFSSTFDPRLGASHSFVLSWPRLSLPPGFSPLARMGTRLPNLPLESFTPAPAPAPGTDLGSRRQGPYLPSPSLPSPAHPDLGLVSRAQLQPLRAWMEFPLGLSDLRSHLSSCLQPPLEREIRLGSSEGLEPNFANCGV